LKLGSFGFLCFLLFNVIFSFLKVLWFYTVTRGTLNTKYTQELHGNPTHFNDECYKNNNNSNKFK